MNPDIILKHEDRLPLLHDCEVRVKSGCRRGLEATIYVAEALREIDRYELYEDKGYTSLTDYAKNELKLSPSRVSWFLRVGEAINVIKDADLALPENETQAFELGGIKDRKVLIETWRKFLKDSEETEEPITVSRIKEIATKAKRTRSAPGVHVSLDLSQSNGETHAPDKVTQAMARIRHICGNSIADAAGHIPRQQVLKWADQDDEMVKTLGYHVIDKNWSVNKALRYEENAEIGNETTLGYLIMKAKNNDGHFELTLNHAHITIDLKR